MSPLAENPPYELKKCFFYSKLHKTTRHYRVWTALLPVCCRVMAGQSLAWKGKLCFFWKVRNSAQNWVFGPEFWPQMC